jgi:hypothetical protein
VGGVQLGPPGTSATNWPIVHVACDYEDGEFGGMMIGRGNQSTRRKPAPVPLCQPQIPHNMVKVKVKVKISLLQAVEAPRVARSRGSHIT